MTKDKALEKVKTLSGRIEGAEISLDSWKWQRAEAMDAAAAAGATTREIAEAAGLGSTQTPKHIAVGAAYRGVSAAKRPVYSEAYDAITGFDRDAAQKRSDAARAKRVLADPKERAKVIDSLPAADQAQIATDLTAKTEVREEILKAGPMAVDQHFKVTDEAIKQRIKKQEHEVKKERPVVAGKTAADYIGEAAELLTRALQEVNEYGVEMKHDRLGRISSGLKRVKRYTKEIEAALDVEIEDEDTTTDDLYIA